jgi:cytochrome bd-type quinol oxidase subunit 1
MWKIAIWQAPLALLGILVGWIFTEMGRQPWIVFGLMLTQDGVSPNVPGWTVLISLIAFTRSTRSSRSSSSASSSRRSRRPQPCPAR